MATLKTCKHNLKMLFIKNSPNLRYSYRKLRQNLPSVYLIRTKSSAEPKTKAYSHTILFPTTDFPARPKASRDEIQKKARFSELYQWQRETLSGPEFVLHDGPPYANGDLHMGHAVNKIIKDINNRSQLLQGNKVHYVPGWDCHGLPIELKALQKLKSKKELKDPVEIRQIARTFALETVERQKEAFESWGVMADWEKQCYLTLDKKYVQNQLRQFYEMYKSGLIYRALKPVFWSPSSKTALAEAELEYDSEHKSKEIYVSFKMENVPQILLDVTKRQKPSVIIWTTTPWSLPANRAVCFHPSMRYSLVAISKRPEELFIVGSSLVGKLEKVLGEMKSVFEFDGHHLITSTYHHPLTSASLPLLPGDHVSDSKGTGLVHTAPAHGPDDFIVARKYAIDVECNIDESGCYTNLDPNLNGLPVLTTGQDTVISRLQDSILYAGTYVHSYPLDWRTKQPIIIRASYQWFIDTDRLKDQALAALQNISLLPSSTSGQHRSGFESRLRARRYWCISRQRAWGVPVPSLYVGGDAVVDRGIIENLCSLIEAKGTDVWWTCDVTELLTKELREKIEREGVAVSKGQDIMDIWLDSGLSWQTLSKKSRVYSEGVDQLTGWFQASLLTALALRGDAPYESIFVHGFVVDEQKRKMSKSIGNVTSPTTIIHGGENRVKEPAYGIDTLRWWVASHATQHSQIIISKKLLLDCQSEVVRIRNILKYLLGAISDLEKHQFEAQPTLNYFDAYMVKETHDCTALIYEQYNNFKYNHVVQTILHFISNKVSGLYCHCIKDRIYCSPKKSNERLSAQLVMHTMLVSIFKALGPILPHLIEEAWQHHPLCKDPFYFTQNIPVLAAKDVDKKVMDEILDIKKDICASTKNENLKKMIAHLKLPTHLYETIANLNASDGVNDSVLCEILELSSVSVEEVRNGGKCWQIEISQSGKNQCLRCRKYNALDTSDKCLRCENAVSLL